MDERFEQLRKTTDPNEFIRLVRRWAAESSDMSESELFPLPQDSAADVIEGFIGVWLSMCAQLPLRDRAQVVDAIEGLISMLKETQGYWPADANELKRDILRCLRKGHGGGPMPGEAA
jgi:hypothetical protein